MDPRRPTGPCAESITVLPRVAPSTGDEALLAAAAERRRSGLTAGRSTSGADGSTTRRSTVAPGEGVAVPVRRTRIVVLLAAVLMHGVPSMATEEGAAPVSHVGTSASDGGMDLLPVAAVSSADEVTAHDGERTDHGSTSHPMASHAWNACLAVLLMGMALLAAAGFRRLPSLTERRVTPRVRGPIGWVRPPRPPDLAALCLLRT